MELKAGYKQTEVGMIPENWNLMKLKQIVKDNRIPSGIYKDKSFYGQGSKIIKLGDVFGYDYFVPDVAQRVELSLEEITNYRVKVGDIIIALASVKLEGVGKVMLVASLDEETAYDHNVALIRLVEEVDQRYIFYLFKSDAVRKLVGSRATQVGTTFLKTSTILEFPLPLPPLVEQRDIAAALSDVDALIAALDRLIAKKRDIKHAAMQELLTGKRRLPGFSGEWEIAEFGDITSPRKERIDPRSGKMSSFCIELEHIASETGILTGSTTTHDLSSLKSVFYPKDILFGKLRSYLMKYWIADQGGVCSTEIWVFPPSERVISEYLFQIVRTGQFIEAASTAYGTHMPRADWNIVKHQQILLPLPEEQNAIATILSEMDAEIAAIEKRREKTLALKQGMMQELLTGRIRLAQGGAA